MNSILIHKDIFLERTNDADTPFVGYVRIFRNLEGELTLKDESGETRALSTQELSCLVLACATEVRQ